MKGRVRWIAVFAILAAALVLVFAFPERAISPGGMLKGHLNLSGDCFACHVPLLGSRPEKCMVCHAVDRIGRFTVAGAPIAGADNNTAFHQHLTQQDCMACHTEHRGVDGALSMKPFSHQLLDPAVRGNCAACHAKPQDSLHLQFKQGCLQCHSPRAWRPATFDHSKYFVLDRDHNAPCATCHVDNDFSRHTCFGCHEHTPARIRAKHLEEGIRNLDNCIKCHRSADERENGDD